MDSDLRDQYLEVMGIAQWVLRSPAVRPLATSAGAVDDGAALAPECEVEPLSNPLSADGGVPGLDWQQLQSRVAVCTGCELHASRTRTVFGVGDRHAEWMIIGEAPGGDEDRQGEPFVGRAGQLLNAMLRAVGLGRDQVFIANILKCRPPRNRDPLPGEVAACEPYLRRQIALVQPKLILAVGRIAAQNLLNTDTNIGRLRGQVHHYGAERIPLVVTYHPAYLLRSPREKRKSWQDLRLAESVIRQQQR